MLLKPTSLIHLSSILEHLCINITQANFTIFSVYFTKHVQIHNFPIGNAQDYSINKTKKVFSDCSIRNCGNSFWYSLTKLQNIAKTMQTLSKTTEISFTM